MLRWAMIFAIIALVAAVLGFGGIAATAAGFAKILFYIFVVLFLVALSQDWPPADEWPHSGPIGLGRNRRVRHSGPTRENEVIRAAPVGAARFYCAAPATDPATAGRVTTARQHRCLPPRVPESPACRTAMSERNRCEDSR